MDTKKIAEAFQNAATGAARLDTDREHMSMTEQLAIARKHDMLAEQSELIRLEALCRIADALATAND